MLVEVAILNFGEVFSFTSKYTAFYGRKAVKDPWTNIINKGTADEAVLAFSSIFPLKGPVIDLAFCGILCGWVEEGCAGIQIER